MELLFIACAGPMCFESSVSWRVNTRKYDASVWETPKPCYCVRSLPLSLHPPRHFLDQVILLRAFQRDLGHLRGMTVPIYLAVMIGLATS